MHLSISLLAIAAASAGAANTNPQVALIPDLDLDFGPGPVIPSNPDAHRDQTFSLRHIYHHGTYRHPTLHRKKDIDPIEAKVFLPAEDGYPKEELPPLRVKTRPDKIERLVDRRPSVVDSIVTASRRMGSVSMLSPEAWTLDDITVPDVTDKETVVNLAYIAADAYVEKEGDTNWEDVSGSYNRSADFGWEAQGLRGHVWADDEENTIIIGLKGTSLAVFEGDGTSTNDKINDNLFFSCCCGQQGQWSWHKVCDCASGTYQCNNTCVREALYDEHRYYTAAKELYSNVTELYPHAEVWLTGHSLGGAVASLLGLTYGVPVVTFQAVPEALPARRLGLPVPPYSDPEFPQARQFTGAWHFGHTADPIYMGVCNGATASCSYAGYAMESVCHTGMECVYDVVADKGWRVGVGTHTIKSVIHDVLMKYDKAAECKHKPECSDCAAWKFYESNGSDGTTTSSSTTTSKTRTRTATCQTPGWWGCLDTTTTATTPPSSSSSSTSTCQTPGWFGCKDKTTTETTTTTTATTASSTTSDGAPTTTCETPGRFWGCNDKTDSPTATPTTPEQTGGEDAPLITPAPTADPPAPTDTPSKNRCLRRTWYGRCTQWKDGHSDDEEEGGSPGSHDI